MIEKFITTLLANVSEQVLMDIFRAIVREVALKRKKADFSQAVDDLKKVIEETATTEMSDEEKNARLISAGRSTVERLRD